MSLFLYDLIHSLDMREKIYFKRYSKIHGNKEDKVYLKIYEKLERLPSYERKPIFNSSETKDLAPYNRYLADQILKSLVNYHWSKSSSQKLNKQIAFINILSDKGFRKEALKRLRKAKKNAYEKEEFSFILELIQFEIDLLFQHGILNFTNQLNKLQEESEQLIEQINNYHQLRLLKEQIRELQFLNVHIYLTNPENFNHILNHQLFHDPSAALSIRAKEVWHYIQVVKHFLLRNYNDFFQAGKEYLQFFNENQSLFPLKQKMVIYSNYLYAAAKSNRKEAFLKIYEEFDQFQKSMKTDEDYFTYISLVRRFTLAYETKDKFYCQKIINEVENKLDVKNIQFNEVEVDMIAWNTVRACIDFGDFNRAHQWLIFWNQYVKIEHTQHFIKIFSMIIYYELDYLDLLKSVVVNTAKEWSRKKRIGMVEKDLLRFFRKMAKKRDKLIEKEEIKRLFNKLEIYKMDSQQNLIFEEFDICRWINQRLSRLDVS